MLLPEWNWDAISALADAISALAAWVAVAAAFFAVWRQNRLTKRALSAQVFSQLTARWDSDIMRARRKRLAEGLRTKALADIPPATVEDVVDFFEELGTILRNGYLDIEPIWQSFSTAARFYWASCGKAYVVSLRTAYSDSTYYSEFEYLVDKMESEELRKRGLTPEDTSEVKPTASQVQEFIVVESSLL